MSDSLRPHESQHARPPCPSPTPRVHWDSRLWSQWCHPAISSSVIPFSCPQSLPASESFPMSQLFAWGGQSTGVSALASFLPKKCQGWSPSEWTGLLKLMSIVSVMPSNHLILCSPLLLLPPIFPIIRVFSNESVFCITWPKYWNFGFNINPSNEYSGLIFFGMDWLDFLDVQEILKTLLQHHSSKASILQHLAFFVVLFSHLYLTTGKTIALTR